MPIIDYKLFHQYPEVKGVFVGGCVKRGDGSSFRRRAHAHITDGEYKGWICVRSPKRLYTPSGNPSMLMFHELAHILTCQGHTKAWTMKLKELGGVIGWYKKYQGVSQGIVAYRKRE